MEIKIRNLSKNFYSEGKRIEAVDNVNLTIPTNKIFSLLGPSGCGKTTLLRCIIGLEVPDSGEIEIGDEIVWSKDRGIFILPDKRGVSMVFQTYAIWPHMTVFGNVAYPLQISKVPKDEIKRRVGRTLEFVRLEGFEDRAATELSGGQQQRVALARALISEPKVILFDEPLSNLDAKLREGTRKELRSFLTKLKITAVYVTHDRLEALTLSDVIAVMRDGVIVEVGAPKKLYFGSEQRFVADFIGRTNLIEGKVVDFKGRRALIDSPIGIITCERKVGTPEGRKVTVCIRPESFEVLEGEEGRNLNTFKGKVESLLFVGESYEGEVSVGETRLIVRFNPAAILKEGDEIKLYIDPKRCHILLR